jgi:hypothetical protein
MSSIPGLNEPFHEFYDLYSTPVEEFSIPYYFNKYAPDNQDDYNCTMVISPSTEKGARKWTLNGKIITIGIYRDEGREAQKPAIRNNITWERSGTKITLTDTRKHRLSVGETIDVWNVNISSYGGIEVTEVLDDYRFRFRATVMGGTSGTEGSYQSHSIINFYETYRVFRLLPSFKLISLAELNQIFSDVAPKSSAARRTMFNISENKEKAIPLVKSSDTNYELPAKTVTKDSMLGLTRRYNQVYDENSEPLKLSYEDNGRVAAYYNVDSAYSNEQIFRKSPPVNSSESRIYVYDFYGVDLNDSQRGPYHSSDIVTVDDTVSGDIGNLKVKLDNAGDPVYAGKLHDEFGNLAIGVQQNNALTVRKQILPLALDIFNRPIKTPLN